MVVENKAVVSRSSRDIRHFHRQKNWRQADDKEAAPTASLRPLCKLGCDHGSSADARNRQ